MSSVRKNISIVLIGNMSNVAIGFILSAYIARYVSVEQYGLYGTVNAALILLPSIIDLGLSVTLVKYITDSKYDPLHIFNTVFFFKLVVGVLLVPLSLIFAPGFSDILLNDIQHSSLIPLIFVGSTAASAASAYQSYSQVKGEFPRYVILGGAPALFRLVATVIGIHYFKFSLQNLIALTCLAPTLGVLMGFFFYRKETKPMLDFKVLRSMIGFSKWLAITTICGALMQRVDIFLLNKLSSPKEVGYYYAALQIAFVIPIVTMSVSNVLLPKVVTLTTKQSQKEYVRKVMSYLPHVMLMIVLVMLSARYLFSLVFGAKFTPSAESFTIITSVFLLGVIITPLGLLVYPLNKPQLQTLLFIVQLIIMCCIDYFLIPLYGATGAAVGVLATKLFGAAVIMFWIYKYVYQQSARPEAVEDNPQAV